ncbi:MAG: hypothetical protein ABFE13_05720 [Phycisphaerales bacterium]
MERLEKWRIRQVTGISHSPQVAAFHLAALTEEKFRVSAIHGLFLSQARLAAHEQARDDIFALEWALRGLVLPIRKQTSIENLRASWQKSVQDKAMEVLKNLVPYSSVRDLVICAKRGGYVVDTPEQSAFHFKDPSTWLGVNDIKSRLVAERISTDRNSQNESMTPETFSLDETSMYEDFPHNVKGPFYSGSDFWYLWTYIFQLCSKRIREDCRTHNYGAFAATSETRGLCILITKRKLIGGIVKTSRVEERTASLFVGWLTFNSNTPRKFSLFHCPLIEVNEKFVLIVPHVVLLAFPPTTFLRLLAHHDKRTYDTCCSRTEKQSLRHLKEHIEATDRIVRTGVKFRASDGEVELDIVEYNRSSSTLSVGQAKFTIRPDSWPEVDHENEVLQGAIEQLKRDRSVLCEKLTNIQKLLDEIGVQDSCALQIDYFLLPTRFTGSDFLEIPDWVKVLPIEFCLRSECKGRPLRSIWADYRRLWDSLDETVKSSRIEQEIEIAGMTIRYPGFALQPVEN